MTPMQTTRFEMLMLLDRYADVIDNDRLEEWPDLFAEDCLYEIIPKENEDGGFPAPLIRCDNRRMLHDRIVSLRQANIYAPMTYRHFFSGLVISDIGADTVDFSCNYLVVSSSEAGDSRIYQVGRYLDRAVRDSGDWLFASKRAIFDTARVQTLLALPI
ncbi:anthranilate 1,2-dioxygenase small subunit AndAd [Sphingomonas sp.]|uniref:anthranilate 1,2-dioxygenase small subunit AndAd n=1 Tax=Sphingomonas sp. TaxID=28214 RepID=UPI000DB13A13|nr:anthranilate 1,2-dioxygenase small subunit AndAd [Sphingomonas sp.]PZU10786.1 MAG: anthranilate 1,2-dioxygenase [Sphingomonas sp.]